MKLEQRLINIIEGQLEGLPRSQQMDVLRAISAFCTVRIEKMVDDHLQRLPVGCDHKFVDSKHCLKCGWTPTPA